MVAAPGNESILRLYMSCSGRAGARPRVLDTETGAAWEEGIMQAPPQRREREGMRAPQRAATNMYAEVPPHILKMEYIII